MGACCSRRNSVRAPRVLTELESLRAQFQWKRFVHKLHRLRKLQRLFGYIGYHLKSFGSHIRKRLQLELPKIKSA